MERTFTKAEIELIGLSGQTEGLEDDLETIRRIIRRPLKTKRIKNALTAPQALVVRAVAREPGIPIKRLARTVRLAHSTVSSIVDRLEKRGLVKRMPSAEDGRVRCVHPTAATAHFVYDEIPLFRTRPLIAALKHISDSERTLIWRAVRDLRNLLVEAAQAGNKSGRRVRSRLHKR